MKPFDSGSGGGSIEPVSRSASTRSKRPASVCSRVVLPAPEGPMMASVCGEKGKRGRWSGRWGGRWSDRWSGRWRDMWCDRRRDKWCDRWRDGWHNRWRDMWCDMWRDMWPGRWRGRLSRVATLDTGESRGCCCWRWAKACVRHLSARGTSRAAFQERSRLATLAAFAPEQLDAQLAPLHHNLRRRRRPVPC